MHVRLEEDVFKNVNTIFYYCSQFFPVAIRRDIFALYGFIKIVRDYADLVPARPDHFSEIEQLWSLVRDDPTVSTSFTNEHNPNELVVRDMAQLQQKYSFNPEWTDALLASVRMDLSGRSYRTLDDTLTYFYGSAEVVGLYMSQILLLHPDAHYFAQMQARAMQQLDCIGDLAAHTALGRNYFPLDELQTFGLTDLKMQTAFKYPVAYKDFVSLQLSRYHEWQLLANEGFRFLKRRYRVPVRTAIDMYAVQAARIDANPFVVFEAKRNPGKWQLYAHGLKRAYYG